MSTRHSRKAGPRRRVHRAVQQVRLRRQQPVSPLGRPGQGRGSVPRHRRPRPFLAGWRMAGHRGAPAHPRRGRARDQARIRRPDRKRRFCADLRRNCVDDPAGGARQVAAAIAALFSRHTAKAVLVPGPSISPSQIARAFRRGEDLRGSILGVSTTYLAQLAPIGEDRLA